MSGFSKCHRRYWKAYLFRRAVSCCLSHDINLNVVKLIRQELLKKSPFGKFSKGESNCCFEIYLKSSPVGNLGEFTIYLKCLAKAMNSENPETGCLYQLELNSDHLVCEFEREIREYVKKILIKHCYIRIQVLSLTENVERDKKSWLEKPRRSQILRPLFRKFFRYSFSQQPSDMKWSDFFSLRQKVLHENFGQPSFTSMWQSQIKKKSILHNDFKYILENREIRLIYTTDNGNDIEFPSFLYHNVRPEMLKNIPKKRPTANKTDCPALVQFTVLAFKIEIKIPFMAVAVCSLCHCSSYEDYYHESHGDGCVKIASERVINHIYSAHLSFKFIKNYRQSENEPLSILFRYTDLDFDIPHKLPYNVKDVYY